ncbi:MAG: pentaheme c-type cytochrome TorC [Hyphomicrobiales bacterium]|nr:MAG: pentaheme c-type cytochrome TorC [Hyphomicrobiales bacterium]
MIAKIWKFFWSPSARYSLGGLVIAGGVLGILFWGGFNTFMEYTNTMEFCISCHEMRDNVYQEYKQTIHYSNRTGVQAICSDCHVPKDWTRKLIRKIKASGELYHKLMGTIGTKEKFEARRLHLARNVWKTMEETDSIECRNCHSSHAMKFEAQKPKSAEIMKKGFANGETCIACHKGIAHKLPDMSQGYLVMFEDMKKQSSKGNSDQDTLYTIETKPFFMDSAEASDGGKGSGRLMSATEVKVVERDGDKLKIRINGWQQDKVNRLIYELRGQRIFSAVLSKKVIDKVVIEKTEVDPDTELTWHKVHLDVWVPNNSLIADKEKLWEYGSELFNASCSVCHSLPSPSHSLANQWIGVLKAMKRFIVLDKEQYRFLQKYLQMHAKDTGGAAHHG